MTPPDLARHTPVPDIIHPVVIGVGPHIRDNFGLSVFNSGDGFFSQGFDAHKPLFGQVRFNHCLAAVTVADTVFIGFNFDQQTLLIQIFYHSLAAFKSVQSFIGSGFGGHVAIVADDLQAGKVMTGTDFKVIGIMGRGDFQSPGAKGHVYIAVFNDRNFSIHQRQYDRIVSNVLIAWILGVNRHRSVT